VPEEAKEVKTTLISTDGLESLFEMDSPSAIPIESSSAQDQTILATPEVQDSSNRSELIHPITVEEAASLLGISTNAVCKRLRKGVLKGTKRPGKFKDEWLVEGEGLIKVVELDFTPVQDSPTESVKNPRPFQDQTPPNSSSFQDSSPELLQLIDLVEKQAAKLEIAAGQIGYLQAQLESQMKLLEAKDSQIELLTDSQLKPNWWQRFCSWFVSGGQ